MYILHGVNYKVLHFTIYNARKITRKLIRFKPGFEPGWTKHKIHKKLCMQRPVDCAKRTF